MKYNEGKLVSIHRMTIQINTKQTFDNRQQALKPSDDVCQKSPTNILVKNYI